MSTKTLIAVPCMDMVATGFCQSLAMLRRVGDCLVTHVAGSLVYDSRNKIALKALELGCSHVMWFDSDMVFAPDTLEKLMAHDKMFVSGVYYKRTGTYEPVVYEEIKHHDDGRAEAISFKDYPTDGIFKAAGVGFGCVLLKTELLLEMGAEFHDWFTPYNRMGEDLSFCDRTIKLGHDIWVDPSVQCGHVGQIVVTDQFYKAYKVAEANNVKSQS